MPPQQTLRVYTQNASFDIPFAELEILSGCAAPIRTEYDYRQVFRWKGLAEVYVLAVCQRVQVGGREEICPVNGQLVNRPIVEQFLHRYAVHPSTRTAAAVHAEQTAAEVNSTLAQRVVDVEQRNRELLDELRRASARRNTQPPAPPSPQSPEKPSVPPTKPQTATESLANFRERMNYMRSLANAVASNKAIPASLYARRVAEVYAEARQLASRFCLAAPPPEPAIAGQAEWAAALDEVDRWAADPGVYQPLPLPTKAPTVGGSRPRKKPGPKPARTDTKEDIAIIGVRSKNPDEDAEWVRAKVAELGLRVSIERVRLVFDRIRQRERRGKLKKKAS